MVRPTAARAIATKTSIDALWATASAQGEVTIRVDSHHHLMTIRQRLYAHRGALRKQSAAHLGIEASHLDGYKISYWPETQGPVETGRYFLRIAYDSVVEFDLILPDGTDMEDLPHFDTTLEPEPEPPSARVEHWD